MGKTVTFGEIMLRLSPPGSKMIGQTESLEVTFGGGEANVAVSLAILGHESTFVTAVPDNDIGQSAIGFLNRYAVNTDSVIKTGDRLGIYFLQHGASIRPSKVTYDRKNSSVSTLSSGSLDWKDIFKDKNWFHITGITPAISNGCTELALESVKTAKNMGLKVSCDLNYRKKLWTREEAGKCMSELVRSVDVLIANEEDAKDVFGIHADGSNIEDGVLSLEGYKTVARQLMDKSGASLVAITLRESISASDNNWSALLYDGEQFFNSTKYHIHLVDRVGGGDSFAAGLIHGLLSGFSNQDALDFAVAASALKQTIHGDVNLSTEKEIISVVKGNLSGRVQR